MSSNNISKHVSAHPSGPWRFLRASRENPAASGSSCVPSLWKAWAGNADLLLNLWSIPLTWAETQRSVYFYLCMTGRGVVQVYKVNVNAFVARYQHFRRSMLLLLIVLWGENEFYYWALIWPSMDLRGFNAWEPLQNREQRQLDWARNSLLFLKYWKHAVGHC